MTEAETKTREHINRVGQFLDVIVTMLMERWAHHDESKLKPPELEIFEIYTNKLRHNLRL